MQLLIVILSKLEEGLVVQNQRLNLSQYHSMKNVQIHMYVNLITFVYNNMMITHLNHIKEEVPALQEMIATEWMMMDLYWLIHRLLIKENLLIAINLLKKKNLFSIL